ncbi:MAG: sulfite exporter TauE/SafE family protein [Thaumarchaeota archaeon]|nr:sulfite exporter TauE/SafE family protein [Nitrososphaerota archaeon]
MVLDLLILAVIGIVGGFVGSMVGLAGGFLFVPALSFMGYPPYMVASTSLFAACTNASTSSYAYAKKKLLTYSLALRLTIFAVPGALIGAYIADSISMNDFKLVFAIVTLAVAGITIIRARLKQNLDPIESVEAVKHVLKNVRSHKLIIVYAACFFAGIVSSLFGIGGGVIFMPLLLAMFVIPVRFSTPVSLLAVAILAGSGLIIHTALANTDFLPAIILAGGTLLGTRMGTKTVIGKKIKEKNLKNVLAIMLFGVSAVFFIDLYFFPLIGFR